jgi:hypothetical protein
VKKGGSELLLPFFDIRQIEAIANRLKNKNKPEFSL